MSSSMFERFDENLENVDNYIFRLKQFMLISKTKEDFKTPFLISSIGPKYFGILRNLVFPEEVDQVPFDKLCRILLKHFNPKTNIIYERFVFQKMDQKSGEAISKYIIRLKEQAQRCNFGDFLLESLRDRFVAGIIDTPTQKKLLQEEGLTFEGALDIALSAESADNDLHNLKRSEDAHRSPQHLHAINNPCKHCAETSAFLAETKDSWIADSGATDHMTFRREWFSTFEEIPEGVHPVCLGDGKKIYAKEENKELTCLLCDNNVHINCPQETKLNQNLRFNIKDYTKLRMDRPRKFGGGLAVLIKTLEIKFKEIAYNQSKPRESTTEAQAIEIYLTDKTIPIINVYHHDNTSINTGLIETLSEASSDIAIILGDFNAERPTWGSPVQDNKDNGRQFVSGEFEQFTKMNGIRHTKTSPYNPSTNVLAERYVREFENLLRKNNGKDDLETNLQSFLFAHRAFPQTVIKEFPGGTANEEKFKIKILEFNTKMRNPREVFHEAKKPPKKTTAIFLDMTSAFDRVWREKLREKLHNIGVREKTLTWIADFLRGRRLKVWVNGEFSKEGKTWACVPQGSVLSPLLYLLYINDIHRYLTEDTKVACYADDIAIWHTSSSIEKSKGKSTTTALNEVLEGFEMGLNKGAWVLLVTLDIDGAFNSVSWNKLMRNLMDMGCPDNLCSLVRDFLRDRRISLSFGGRNLERNFARGCPQGSCCGPILWNILVNTVFQEELPEGARLVLYADDQFLIIEAASRAKAEKCVEASLQILSN
ncbi:hypothetical protein LAZ67_4001301 [Cordylochernes scorpioides]|uniref:Reverse transcriptase n=1 Tax=Cordylochernes scorpioides TaxID=51811 RepID=A0ABY6KGJ7_9ARAC|nr:hypothetical protein LAZ67_4001301 [Cordylochernes scorpioides]